MGQVCMIDLIQEKGWYLLTSKTSVEKDGGVDSIGLFLPQLVLSLESYSDRLNGDIMKLYKLFSSNTEPSLWLRLLKLSK